VPAPLRVATYNLHAGVDGWGRPSDVVDAAAGLDADVLFVQEAWRGDGGVDLAAEIAARTGATALVVPLAAGARVTGGAGSARWHPASAMLVGNRGLYLDSVRALPDRQRGRLAAARGVERGEWCVGLVTRLPVVREATLTLRELPRDRSRRLVVTATLAHETGPLEVVALHGAHLSHGSLGQYRELVADLDARLDPGSPAVLGGDLNCWGVLARRVLRGWTQAARGATWPSWRPHSQLDHLFVRGPVRVVAGRAVDRRGSDHRPVVADLVVRPTVS
jgi:endonuclease/exonuclease/phosphatase family metal-dependent hydrolase